MQGGGELNVYHVHNLYLNLMMSRRNTETLLLNPQIPSMYYSSNNSCSTVL